MADNRFVTELIVQMASGNAAAIEQFKKGLIDSGMAAKEAAKATAEFAKASATVTTALNQEADANRKAEAAQTSVNKAKAAALDITKQQAAASRAAGGVGGGSLVGALYSDPVTKQIVTVQNQIAAANKRLSEASGTDIAAWQAKVDNLNKKYGAFSQTIQQIAGVSKDAFLKNAGGEQIAAIINNAEKLNATLPRTGKHLDEVSTKGKYNTNQMLQYTAAIRNTAESLASGMSPATVAMTQGMQVLGAYMGENIGLMVKLGAVAAITAPAVLTVMRAMSLESQSRDITATSIAYSNMAVSVNEAADSMRRLAENSKFSRDEALTAVKELTKLRSLSPDMRQGIMGAVAPFATVTGQDVGPAAKQLGEAFGGSFEGIRKLDEQFGFLNSTQLETVRIMMKLGDVTGANRIAMDAFTKQMKAAGEAAEGSFTLIGRAIASTLNRALDDAARNPVMQWIMRQSSEWARGVNNNGTPTITDENRAAVEAFTPSERALRYMGRTTGQRVVDQIAAESRAAEMAAENATKAINTQNGAYKTQLEIATKVNIERARAEAFERYKSSNPLGLTNTPGGAQTLTDWATKMAAADPSVASAIGAQTLQDRGIQRQIDAEKALAAASFDSARAMSLARAEAARREAAAQGHNASLAYAASLAKDEAAAMQTLGGEYSKLTDQERFLADAKSKGFVQASIELKMRQLGISASKEIAVNIAKEIAEKERLNEAENAMLRGKVDLLGASNDNLSASERAYRIAVLEADKTLEQTRNTIDYTNAITKAKIARDEMNASEGKLIRTQMNPELAYRDRLATIDQATGVSEADKLVARRLAEREYRDALIARKEAEDDWASGADRAFMKYSKSVGTVADQTERVMTNAFKSMEDAMVEFAMTGELSFEKMAKSIIADLIRMQIQMSITIPLAKAMQEVGGFGGLFGKLFSNNEPPMPSTAPVGQVTMSPLTNAHGNVFPFAKGSVVNGVTPFRFGQGGAMSGIMGEAGPEAIVPLTRTPQGDLGIRSTGGSAQVKVEVIDQRGSGAPIDVETQMGAFGPIVRIIARDEANKAVQGYAKGGGLTNQLRQDYNIRQPAVNRG